MGQSQIIPLTDEEIASVMDDPQAVAKFTSDERRRMSRLSGKKADDDQWATLGAGGGGGSEAYVPPTTTQMTAALPMVGGAAGGMLGAVGGPAGSVGGAALGAAGGESARQLINRATGNPAPATPLAAAGEIAKQGAISGAAEGAGVAIGAGAKAAGPWLMQKALKPAGALLKEYKTTAPELVKTLLDEGVSITQSGLDKLQKLFDATNDEIRAAVAAAPGTIDKQSVAARALPTAGRLANQVNPTKDLQAVGETVGEFMNHPVYSGPTLSVPEAQAMKTGTYKQIGKKYGEVSSAAIETQKALARGLKEDIASEVPQIAALNARDSQLMASMDAVGRRVALSGNKDPVGFAWVTQHPVTFLAALIDRNPSVKSYLARGLYTNAGRLAGVSPQLIRAAAMAAASGDDPQATDGSAP